MKSWVGLLALAALGGCTPMPSACDLYGYSSAECQEQRAQARAELQYLRQERLQQQQFQQQNMNNLQQFFQNRAAPQPSVSCSSVPYGMGGYNTYCQ